MNQSELHAFHPEEASSYQEAAEPLPMPDRIMPPEASSVSDSHLPPVPPLGYGVAPGQPSFASVDAPLAPAYSFSAEGFPAQEFWPQPSGEPTGEARGWMPPPVAPMPFDGSGSSMQGSSDKGKSFSMEKWLGRNVLGAIASVLIFLGMVFLGFLVIPSWDETAKVVFMFLLSSVFVIGGTVLTLTKKSAFTQALLGCGCGSFFISIMVTSVFFRMLSDVVVFALLLLWLVGVLVLVKLSGSLFVSIVAHAGMIISLCFAYGVGIKQDTLVLTVVYHAFSVVLITAGNKICCKKTFKFGLFASLFLSLVAVMALFSFYEHTLTTLSSIYVVYAVATFLIQLGGALVLSVFLSYSIARVEDGAGRVVLYFLNNALLFGVIFVASYLFPSVLVDLAYPTKALWFGPSYQTLLIPTLITVSTALGYLLIILIGRAFQKKQHFEGSHEAIAVIVSCVYSAVFALGFYMLSTLFYPNELRLPGLIVLSLVLALCFSATRNRTYLSLSFGFLLFDLVLMFCGGYKVLVVEGSMLYGFIYLELCVALLLYFWFQLDAREKSAKQTAYKIMLLGVIEGSGIAILSSGGVRTVVILLGITAALIVLFATKFEARKSKTKGLWYVMRIHELVLVGISSCAIAGVSEKGIFYLLQGVLAGLSIILLGCFVYRLAHLASASEGWGVAVSVCFTFVIMASIEGMTSWFKEPYVFSLVLMASALICVGGGFIARLKSLRMYGLVVIIVSVLKLVTFDMGAAETLMRVVACIAGGLMCFGISALYNYAVKRLEVS